MAKLRIVVIADTVSAKSPFALGLLYQGVDVVLTIDFTCVLEARWVDRPGRNSLFAQ
jgi:hypothetical protein